MLVSDKENKMPCECLYQLAVKIHNHLHLYMHNIAELTAPIMIRNISHLYPQMTTRGVGVWTGTCCILNTGHRKIAKKPVSRSCDSQPEIIIKPQLNIHATMQHKTLQINNFRWRVTIIYFQTQIFKRNYAALL